MEDQQLQTTAGHRYSAAHDAHYSARDLPLAMKLYEEILAADPESPEAKYSRSQIQNLVRAVIPADDLLSVEKKMLNAFFAASPDEGAASL